MSLLDSIFGAEESEAMERRRVRRAFAYIAATQVFVITVVFLVSMFFDEMAARVEKAWPPFAVMFPSLLIYLMHYTHVGSKETAILMKTKAETATTSRPRGLRRSTDGRNLRDDGPDDRDV